ncbi:hypothetical protein FKM82_016681 [Ascaphus truei]
MLTLWGQREGSEGRHGRGQRRRLVIICKKKKSWRETRYAWDGGRGKRCYVCLCWGRLLTCCTTTCHTTSQSPPRLSVASGTYGGDKGLIRMGSEVTGQWTAEFNLPPGVDCCFILPFECPQP